MSSEKNQQEKTRLHPRNRNKERYDLSALVTSTPALKSHIIKNKFGAESVDFSSPLALKLLNTAILNHYYGIKHWEFPDENLCPPIPGRAEYIHHIADVLAENNYGTIPIGNNINCLDVGIGASCIYPIIGTTDYGWNFIGSDINPKSIASAKDIISSNANLKGKIDCRLQENANNIFQSIIGKEEKIELTICNPPFHSSMEDAQKGTQRKAKDLKGRKEKTPVFNLAGISKELIYDGGEFQFIENMIYESKQFAKNCFFFSTLVSKQSNLKRIYKILKITEAKQVKTIPMGTSNKSARIVVWTFLSMMEQKEWRESRWNSKQKNL